MGRIVGIHDQTGAADLEKPVLHVVEIDLPFLILQFHVDAELVLPGLLDRFGNHAVIFRGIIKQRNRWQALASGITGLGQETSRFVQIEFGAGATYVAADAFGREMIGGDFSGEGDVCDEALTVDRHRERASHEHIIERRFSDVEVIVIDAGIRMDVEFFGCVALIDGDLGERHAFGFVKLSGAEGGFFGGLVFHRDKPDAI